MWDSEVSSVSKMDRWMISLFTILFFLAGKCLQAQSEAVDNNQYGKPDIPKRCVENSVTKVSCKNFVSDDALLPHPDDCELFYYCVSPDHAPICRQCPTQLHFNPIKHVCDLPERAGCVVTNNP